MQQRLCLSNTHRIHPTPVTITTDENNDKLMTDEMQTCDSCVNKKYSSRSWLRLCSLTAYDRYDQANKYNLCRTQLKDRMHIKTDDDNSKENKKQRFLKSITDAITTTSSKRKNDVKPIAKERASALVDSRQYFTKNNKNISERTTVKNAKTFYQPFIFKPKINLTKSWPTSAVKTLTNKLIESPRIPFEDVTVFHVENGQRTLPTHETLNLQKQLLSSSLPVLKCPSKIKKIVKQNERNNAPLQEWFNKNKHWNPYASYKEKKILAKMANISVKQVTYWLINQRVKQNKMARIGQQKYKRFAKQRKLMIKPKAVSTVIEAKDVDVHDLEEDDVTDVLHIDYEQSDDDTSSKNDNHTDIEDNGDSVNTSAESNGNVADIVTKTFPVPLKNEPVDVVCLDTQLKGFEMIENAHVDNTSFTRNNFDETVLYIQQKVFISASNLTIKQKLKIEEFLSKFQIENPLLDIVNEKTTHLITDDVEIAGQSFVCTLTKNVIQAIARHLNVISYLWIDECLKQQRIIDWKDFEIRGDTSISHQHYGARTSRINHLENKRLFPPNYFGMKVSFSLIHSSTFSLLFLVKLCTRGCLGMDSEELGELVWLSGGLFFHQGTFPHTIFERYCFVLVDDENIKNRPGYEEGIKKGVKFLRPRWLVDSVIQQRIQDFWKYNCSPTF
ncbi:unnamed protein product [Didymodactylos carnosus]|uniref:Uncharacterized protein n=1 Tax=Didymodactylos carnosus TaxID=1234261 RepID=A0A8S2HCH9_9BILA|nr:unnamed protein product [Didymodactylos carnosus]CAF3628788.1 unnamed protein product [Didymodactylos carnosus]